jgi:hypothetical protein
VTICGLVFVAKAKYDEKNGTGVRGHRNPEGIPGFVGRADLVLATSGWVGAQKRAHGARAFGPKPNCCGVDAAMISYTQCTGALDGEALALALRVFKSHGGDRNRWRRSDREAMADALSRAEDFLEQEAKGRTPSEARNHLKVIRRKLEAELWP